MRKILIATPPGCYPGNHIDVAEITSRFFSGVDVFTWHSMNPKEIEDADEVIIPGGWPDVSPSRWNEINTGCKIVDRALDLAQYAMIEEAYRLHKPIAAFCRGHQLVAAYLGGSLIQDIDSGNVHRYTPGHPAFHEVYGVPGTRLYSCFGSNAIVNSSHHQAIKRLPNSLKVAQIWAPTKELAAHYISMAETGTLHEGSDECIIEAVEQVDYPYIGMQWHPEFDGEMLCDVNVRNSARDLILSLITNI